MDTQDFSRELEIACTLARRAGEIVLEHYAAGVAVQYKGGDPFNPVTQADRDANSIIVEGLAAAFPDDAILAEESAALESRHGHRRLWCVDPVDGTREFIDHNGQFVVMIGLAIDGAARLGVLYQPTEDALLWGAGREAGALIRGTRRSLKVSDTRAADQATLVVSRSHSSRSVLRAATTLNVKQRMPLGSVGLKISRLAEASADLYISTSDKTHEWDACGPEAVLTAAGGKMTDMCGAPLVYNKPNTSTPRGLVASNGHLHQACIEALRPIVRERGWA